ncbi:MAG: 1-acyl-sn-glycerol-3-phosphate acyltransferase [Flavobacteriales bacterium]|nr:1-acyl-sn-glycerol-3-phosphate acyltransferase [Flavobacteriales bacterium]
MFCITGIWRFSKLRIENDLVAFIEEGQELKRARRILTEHPMGRRIILYGQAKPGSGLSLEEVADHMEKALAATPQDLWKRIEIRQEPEEIGALHSRVMQCLPWLLGADTLRALVRLWDDPEHLQRLFERIFHLVLSPTGGFLINSIQEDPLGLSRIWLARLEAFRSPALQTTAEGWLTDTSGTTVVAMLVSARSAQDLSWNSQILEALEQCRDRLDSEGVAFGYFGAPVVTAVNARRIRNDVWLTLGIALGCVVALLLAVLRRPTLLIPIVFVVGGAALSAVLVASLVMPRIPALSLGLAAVFVGISVDYALHLLVHRAQGLEPEAILRKVARPMATSMLTTVASFLVLVWTRSPVTQAFGWLAAAGIAGACFTALVLIPHFLPLVAADPLAFRPLESGDKLKVWGLGIIILVTAGAAVLYKTPALESDPESLTYMPQELKRAGHTLDSLTGIHNRNIHLAFPALDEQGFYLNERRLDSLAASYKAAGPPFERWSLAYLFPSPEERRLSAQVWDSVFTPNRLQKLEKAMEKVAVRYGIRPEALAGFFHRQYNTFIFPPLDSLINILPVGLQEMFRFQDGKELYHLTLVRVKTEFHSQISGDIRKTISGVRIADNKSLAEALIGQLRSDFQKVANTSALVVFLILLLALGRIETTLIAFLPLALSWLWLGAFMNMFQMSFNLVSLIVCTFVFGLGVDYSVFYLHAAIRRYARGEPPDGSTGRAVFLSAATTILATGGLVFSVHPALRSVGLLSLVGVGSVWFISAVFPQLAFEWLAVRPTAKGLRPHTLKNLLTTMVVWVALVVPFWGALALAMPVGLFTLGKRPLMGRFFRYYVWLWARFYVGMAFWKRRRYVAILVNFKQPSLIFANHQSFIDTAILFSLTPHLIVGTKDRIYFHPIFGPICRLCGYVNVSRGHETTKPHLLKALEEGYSVALFPEGTRSDDFEVHRFHTGLFDLALESGVPLVPVTIVGTGYFLHKGSFWGSRHHLILEVGPILRPALAAGEGAARKLAMNMARYVRERYTYLRHRYGGGPVAADLVRHRFLYLNPWLAWYIRIKLWLENYYEDYHRALSAEEDIVELGCGLGLIGHVLTCDFPGRKYTGYDWDEEKIQIARARCGPLQKNVRFEVANVLRLLPRSCSALIVADTLHYLPSENRWKLMDAWTEALKPGGLIFLRDGMADANYAVHFLTRLSEFFSIRVMQFNKSARSVAFLRQEEVDSFIRRHNLQIELTKAWSPTSNKLWILRKP